MSHDPPAARDALRELTASALALDADHNANEYGNGCRICSPADGGWPCIVRMEVDGMLGALELLTAANLAVIEVGTVPPWMERVAERAHLSGGDSWWYGDEDSPIADYLPGYQPLYIIREDKP